MFNPDKYRSVEWQKGGRAYPALDCFGIVNEIRRDLGLVRGLISPGSRKMITASIGRRVG
jgi:hypothetical protein